MKVIVKSNIKNVKNIVVKAAIIKTIQKYNKYGK